MSGYDECNEACMNDILEMPLRVKEGIRGCQKDVVSGMETKGVVSEPSS